MNRSAALAVIVLVTCLAAQTTQHPSPPKPAPPDPGQLTNRTYRNPSFGFTYKLPYGWVDRSPQMREAATDPTNSMVLLGAFERPPEANGEGVNPGVVIAAESAATYPGLNSAAQYFGPLEEVTKAKGLTTVNQPYEFPIDGKPIVRADFVKQFAGGSSLRQATLAWLEKGYVVSFTFIGSSDDEVLGLLDGLTFAAKKTPPATHK